MLEEQDLTKIRPGEGSYQHVMALGNEVEWKQVEADLGWVKKVGSLWNITWIAVTNG